MTIVVVWLWQGLAIAGVTAAVLRAVPGLRPATRHSAWWAALGAVVGVPLVLLALAVADPVPQSPQLAVAVVSSPAMVLPVVPGWVAASVAGIWTLAAVTSLVGVVLGWATVGRLKRTAVPFDHARAARLPLWSGRAAMARRSVELRMSDAITGACALGFRRPIIVVGRPLADSLDDEALDRVLMHEQAHLDRYDDWTQLIQSFIRALAGLHPAVWWLSRQIDYEREAACDSLVVVRTGEARAYAAALLQAAATVAGARTVPSVVPGATAGQSALRRRLLRILAAGQCDRGRCSIAGSAVVAVPFAVLLACLPFAPLVGVADAVQQPGQPATTRRAPARPPLLTPADGPPVSSNAATSRRAAGPTASRMALSSSASSRSVPATDHPTPAAEPTSLGAAQAPARLESRTLQVPVEAPGVVRGLPDAGAVQLLPAARSSWRTLATSPATAAKDVASALASGAGRKGVSLGRAFTRASKAIAASF